MSQPEDDGAIMDAKITAALRRSSNLMIRQYRALGLPIVVAQQGQVVHLDPHTMQPIAPDELAAFITRAQASWDE